MSILKYMPGSAQTRGGLRPHAPRRPLKRAALSVHDCSAASGAYTVLAVTPGSPPQLSGQRRDHIPRRVHGDADDAHASCRIGYAHPADYMLRVLVQQAVQLRHGTALTDDDGNHCHPGLHPHPSSPKI